MTPRQTDVGHVGRASDMAGGGVPRVEVREKNERMRYLGCLGLLAECSVHVPEDLRDLIERAMEDACAAIPTLTWRRILDRIEIEVVR